MSLMIRTRMLLGLLLCFGVGAAPAWAQENAAAGAGQQQRQILVKGLTQGRAILEVDGELLILSNGESRRGIRMLQADNRAAVMEIDGRRVTMALDQSIARSYSAPEPAANSVGNAGFLYRESGDNTRMQGRTRVRSVRLVEDADNRLALDVDYFYAGDHAGEVRLSAALLRNGEAIGSLVQTQARLTEGERTTVLELQLGESAPLVLQTDAVKLSIAWFEAGRQQGVLSSRTIPFNKYWKKVRVR